MASCPVKGFWTPPADGGLRQAARSLSCRAAQLSPGDGDGVRTPKQCSDFFEAGGASTVRIKSDSPAARRNARLRGSMRDAEAVEREWSDVLRTVRSGLLAVPSAARRREGRSLQ